MSSRLPPLRSHSRVFGLSNATSNRSGRNSAELDSPFSVIIPIREIGSPCRMRAEGWLKTATKEQRAALKRDLQPIIDIHREL